jgi:CHASE3 domain sensor protein
VKIATKLGLLSTGVLSVFCVLAVTLFMQLRTVSQNYDALLNSSVRDMDRARVVQVNFKKQVQEWKDILLRGRNADDLAKYTAQFHNEESEVRAGAKGLEDTIEDPQTRDLLQQFLATHQAMSAKYQQAYEVYVAGKGDFNAADKLVRGQDREPTDLFDKVVQRLQSLVSTAVKAQEASARSTCALALGLSAGLLLLLGVAGFFTVRSILARLAKLKAVSDQLAKAEISGLTIPISGNDEIAEFGESMKGVSAAIEELLKMASVRAA